MSSEDGTGTYAETRTTGTQNKENESHLQERHEKWERLFALDQWFYFGKDFNYELYEMSLLGLEERKQIYFPRGKGDDNKKKTADQLDKKRTQAERYLFAEDILPLVVQPKNSNISPAIDLQALELVVSELSKVPFNEEHFSEFLKIKDDNHTFNVDRLRFIGGLIGVKKNMTNNDWIALRDLYVEFKLTDTIPVNKVYTAVLEMVSRTTSNPINWVKTARPEEKLAALKVGTLLLNLFNFCYSDAIKVVKKANISVKNDLVTELVSEKHLGIIAECDRGNEVGNTTKTRSAKLTVKPRAANKASDRKKMVKVKPFVQPSRNVIKKPFVPRIARDKTTISKKSNEKAPLLNR